MKKMLGKLLIIAGILILSAVVIKDVLAEGLSFINGTEADSASASPHEIESVIIESDHKNVKIIAEERNDISATISGDSGKLFVAEKRRKLELTAKEKEFQFLNGFHRSSLVVRIPYTYKGGLVVRTSSGDVSVAGNKHLALSELNAASASGNMAVTGIRLQELKMKGSSGDVYLELPENGSFKVNAASESGSVSSAYPFADTAHKDHHQITGSHGSGQHLVDIKTDSGDVAIQ
ncbi:DUF4097 domain-containing protein [Bacillus halotolerans]|uniref:DUF4097 domain-containing protein n=1 Tax=Bacillus halotolerans TaxID=260554 RepID=UPI0021557F3C|nr:DUF4097 domain-containing protein [Bacillus halotolerans]MCR6596129.1 DUF4097 domain-containing protein [Bacillus halotolerans]